MSSRNEPIEGRKSMGVITASQIFTPGWLLARSRKSAVQTDWRPIVLGPKFNTWSHLAVHLLMVCALADSMCVMSIFLITDLRFPLDGSVRLHFSTSPESRLMGVNETHTRYTVESSTGNFFRLSFLFWTFLFRLFLERLALLSGFYFSYLSILLVGLVLYFSWPSQAIPSFAGIVTTLSPIQLVALTTIITTSHHQPDRHKVRNLLSNAFHKSTRSQTIRSKWLCCRCRWTTLFSDPFL